METARYVLPLLFLGGFCFWNARHRFLTVRRIEDTARSKAASAPQGQVELQGIAWPEGENAFCSSTGNEVVYHAMKLQREETRGVGKNRRTEWVTVLRQESAPPFFLVDATGLVRVDPAGAELDLLSDRTRTWRSLSQPERQRVLDATAGTAIAGFPPPDFLFGLFSSSFRIVESEIRVGSPIYVHGDFRTAESGRKLARCRGLTSFHARFFDPARREQKNLDSILDADGDSEVSAQEAIEGLCQAAASDRDATRSAASVESEFPVHGCLASTAGRKLFAADRHEEYLVADKGRRVYLPLAGGVACVSAALVLMAGAFQHTPEPQPPVETVAPTGRHAELRSGCLAGKADACDELTRRSVELRVPDDDRRLYAWQACRLGLSRHCIK